MNVLFYLILVLVATYPKVSEIKLIKKYIDEKPAVKKIEKKVNEGLLSNFTETFGKTLKNVKDVCWETTLLKFKSRILHKYRNESNIEDLNGISIATEKWTSKCKFFCVYESWYKIACSSTEKLFKND